jgi:cbb3-type cytochrome oxidase subunit 1
VSGALAAGVHSTANFTFSGIEGNFIAIKGVNSLANTSDMLFLS